MRHVQLAKMGKQMLRDYGYPTWFAYNHAIRWQVDEDIHIGQCRPMRQMVCRVSKYLSRDYLRAGRTRVPKAAIYGGTSAWHSHGVRDWLFEKFELIPMKHVQQEEHQRIHMR